MSSSARIQLRDAKPEDARDIASLLAELGYPADAKEIPSRLKGVQDEGGAVLIAVDEAGVALGIMSLARHATLHSSAPAAYITALVTASSARRRGVGRLLVEEAKRWARDAGCAKLSVTSAEHRSDAHAFYPSSGLPYTGRRFAIVIEQPETA